MPEAKTVRILPGTIEIPHTITLFGKEITFNPDAVLRADIADSFVKTHPRTFAFAEGNPDMTKYTVKKSWKTGLLVDRIKELTDEQQLKVYEFAGKLLSGEEKTDDALDEMTIKDLLAKAKKDNVGIPTGITKKDDIIEFLRMTPEERLQLSQ